jgi:hypothetical protein
MSRGTASRYAGKDEVRLFVIAKVKAVAVFFFISRLVHRGFSVGGSFRRRLIDYQSKI